MYNNPETTVKFAFNVANIWEKMNVFFASKKILLFYQHFVR